MNSVQAAKNSVNWLLDVGIKVHRINDLDISVLLRNLSQSVTKRLKFLAEALSAMGRDQNHPVSMINRNWRFHLLEPSQLAFRKKRQSGCSY